LKEVDIPATKKTRLVIAGLAAVVFGLVAGLYVFWLTPREVSREQFLIQVRQRHLKQAIIYPLDHIAVAGYGKSGAIRTALAEDDQDFLTTLRARGVEVTFATSDSLSP
jgi:hypothetical protein